MGPDDAGCVVDEAGVPAFWLALWGRRTDPDVVRREPFGDEAEDGGVGGVAEGMSVECSCSH